MSKIKTYLKTIAIPLLVGGLSALITGKKMSFDSLIKPVLTPPQIVFPIVWSIIYILMGFSYGILVNNKENDYNIKRSYYMQLLINFIWPIIFFVFKWRFIALIWIVILILAVLNMIIKFYKKNKLAAFLQIPYLIWTLFATYLNLFFYILNK